MKLASTWKKYGEDRALLTGDAMVFLANKIVVDDINKFIKNKEKVK